MTLNRSYMFARTMTAMVAPSPAPAAPAPAAKRRTVLLTPADVEFQLAIEPDHIQVEGNLCATDDPEQDAADTAEVISRLQAGDECAWCMLLVTATATDGTTGTASLGGVSLAADHPWGPALTAYVQEQFPELWTEALDNLQCAGVL